MLKKVIKFTDYNGVDREEAFYFNLTKAEIMKMELSTDGGFAEFIAKVVQEKDNKELVKLFDNFILTAYGEKSADGKHFMKSPEISAKFAATEAYSNLFMELLTDTKAATDFINGLAPVDTPIDQEAAKKFLEEKMR